MIRWAAGVAAMFAAVGLAHGHFLFLIPPVGEGEPVRVVWAAGPSPDPDVGLDPFAGMSVRVIGRDG